MTCLPRFATPRTSRPTLGPAVCKVAEVLGFKPLPWWRRVVDVAFEIDPATQRLAYDTVDISVPRQSGKSTLLIAVKVHRCLSPRFGGPQNVLFTAQSRAQARTKWEDVELPLLARSRLAGRYQVRRSTGREATLWRNGSIGGLIAAEVTSGHGETVDLGIIDEAWSLVDSRLEQALRPAMLTRPQPQLWVVSTAGVETSIYLRGKVEVGRERALRGATDERACYFEWSADPNADPADPETWRSAMPALGLTQNVERVRSDFASMPIQEFRRSHLNVWPDQRGDPVFGPGVWEACATAQTGAATGAVAVDVNPERTWSSVAGADVVGTVELLKRGEGTAWVADFLAGLAPKLVVVDGVGPAGSLVPTFEEAGLTVRMATTREMIEACGAFYDAVRDLEVRHLDQDELNRAVQGAGQRRVQDAWLWSRRSSLVDISPLVAVTLAHWVAQMRQRKPKIS